MILIKYFTKLSFYFKLIAIYEEVECDKSNEDSAPTKDQASELKTNSLNNSNHSNSSSITTSNARPAVPDRVNHACSLIASQTIKSSHYIKNQVLLTKSDFLNSGNLSSIEFDRTVRINFILVTLFGDCVVLACLLTTLTC